jgi:hypothetical protein
MKSFLKNFENQIEKEQKFVAFNENSASYKHQDGIDDNNHQDGIDVVDIETNKEKDEGFFHKYKWHLLAGFIIICVCAGIGIGVYFAANKPGDSADKNENTATAHASDSSPQLNAATAPSEAANPNNLPGNFHDKNTECSDRSVKCWGKGLEYKVTETMSSYQENLIAAGPCKEPWYQKNCRMYCKECSITRHTYTLANFSP